MFLRIFQHLLPRSSTWNLTINRTLRRFFEGLAGFFEQEPILVTDDGDPIVTSDGFEIAIAGADTNPKSFADRVFEDIFPDTTTQLAEWESQFGLAPNPDEDVRRLNLAAEWSASGGQSPAYLQGVLQTAGFNVFVHEWWASGPPYVARDPRDYVNQPLFGQYQCTDVSDLVNQPQCTGFTDGGLPDDGQPQCDNFLANDTGYLVNLDLTPRAPPAIPSDPDKWPFFVYIGAETFPDHASVPSVRKSELERLVLKLRPAHLWIVMLVDYT